MPKINPTKTGWRPIRAIDLLATDCGPGTCDRCGRRDIRRVDSGRATIGPNRADRTRLVEFTSRDRAGFTYLIDRACEASLAEVAPGGLGR